MKSRRGWFVTVAGPGVILVKAILILLVLAGLGTGGYFFWREQQAKSAPEAAQIPTAKVERGPIKLSVSATGRVVATLDVDIKCKASGTITKLPFDISDSVKEGQLLVELDPVDEQRGVDLAKVELTSSSARLAVAKQNLKIAEQKLVTDTLRAKAGVISGEAKAERARVKAARLKAALASSAATQEDADNAQMEATAAAAELQVDQAQVQELKALETGLEVQRQNIVLAEADVESDKITLKNSEQRLKETKVVAPMDGVVAARTVQIGQIISSAISNVGGGTTVLTLSDLSHIYALAAVDESDIGKVKVDQPVVVTADAYPGRQFQGKVVRIATRGTNVSNVVTFEVKIEILDDKKALLKPEMTTNIEVVAAKKDDVLLVPLDAVSRKKGKRYASVQKDSGDPKVPATIEEREVEAGINDGTNLEIVSGLNEGEVVQVKKSTDKRGGGQRPPQGLNTGMFRPGGGR